MGRANNSSVDSTKGDKLASRLNVLRNGMKAGYEPENFDKKDQVVNAKKAALVNAKKEKRKRSAKLAKAAKKKNKK